MKNSVLITSLSLAIVVGGVSDTLASGGKDGRHGRHHSFQEMDANGDGKLMKEEIETHMQRRFEGADTDGNGKLSVKELTARVAERRADRPHKYVAHMIDRHDADGDGELSISELKARHKGDRFARMDTDGDGAVSEQEFEAMKGKHHGHKKGHKKHDDSE